MFVLPAILNQSSTSQDDPYINNVVLHLRADNKPMIVSPTGYSVSESNTTGLEAGKYGARTYNRLYFLWNYPHTLPQDATFEFWVKFSFYTSQVFYPFFSDMGVVYNQNGSSGNVSIAFRNGYLLFYTNSTYQAVDLNFAQYSSLWTHYAMVKTGNIWKIFKQGLLLNTVTYSNTIVSNIALGNNSSSHAFNGTTDNIRITYGVARYTANFNPETDTYLAY